MDVRFGPLFFQVIRDRRVMTENAFRLRMLGEQGKALLAFCGHVSPQGIKAANQGPVRVDPAAAHRAKDAFPIPRHFQHGAVSECAVADEVRRRDVQIGGKPRHLIGVELDDLVGAASVALKADIRKGAVPTELFLLFPFRIDRCVLFRVSFAAPGFHGQFMKPPFSASFQFAEFVGLHGQNR